ncbi:hypothetical protein ColTof4_05975 [Colletotrichum tofieldiae]|nr:hypothetical protein ColTof4_05975 [Colletotrichum tofieldiae]
MRVKNLDNPAPSVPFASPLERMETVPLVTAVPSSRLTSKNPVMKLLGNRLSPLKFSSLK